MPLRPPTPTVEVVSIASTGQVTTVTSSVGKDGTRALMAGNMRALLKFHRDDLLDNSQSDPVQRYLPA